MTRNEYWDLFEMVRQDIECAIACNCTYLTINNLAVSDEELYQTFYRNRGYWHLTQYALQATFFISLGRVFDEKKSTASIQRLVESTIDHPGFFSKAAVRLEKIRLHNGHEPEWLDEYMARAWEPTRADLESIDNALRPHHEKFKQIYQPIRHVYFAHRGRLGADVIGRLFARTVIKDVSEILKFLYTVVDSIWEMWANGTRLDLVGTQAYDRFAEQQSRQAEALVRRIAP